MPVDRVLQASLASGEFDPLLWSREDVGFFYNSARKIENIVPLPQGGGKRAEGTILKYPQRGQVLSVGGSFTYAAPNGGTANNVTSETVGTALTTTTGISTSTSYVIVTIDLGSAQRISGVLFRAQINDLPTSIASATLYLESSSDGVSYSFAASLEVGGDFYLRQFSAGPDTDLATARYWRVRIENAAAEDFSTATVTANYLQFRREFGLSNNTMDGPGNQIVRRVTVDAETEFFVQVVAGQADIFSSAGAWLASVLAPYSDDEVAELKTSQNLDSLILYQNGNPPWIIQRLGADAQWRGEAFAFTSIAQFPYPDSTTGGQNEIQELEFASMSAGNRVIFEFNGDISAEVAWSATAATNVTNFTAAIEALEDITSVTITNSGSNVYAIEFDGADANKFFATLIVEILDGSGTVQNTRKQRGRPHQEDLWSATRGYPRCGTFYQGRHWMGGVTARPDVIVGSRIGDFTQFKEDADPVSSSPLVLSPDMDEQITVENIYPGRNLQIFTSSAELFIPTEPITPDNVALKTTSKRGNYVRTQPVDVQGGTLFVDRNGSALREYLFNDVENSYTAEPISILAGHLMKQPKSMALRLGADDDDPTILYVVNTGRDREGALVPMAMVTIDRAQQVTAFARRTTQGIFEGVAALQGGEVMFVVRRELAGDEWNYLEVLSDDMMSDASTQVDNPDAEQFTATASQTVFTYTFTSPASADDVGVWTRADAAENWMRVSTADYTLDLGAKTVTFDTGQEVGTLVYIAPRQTTAALGHSYMNGIEGYAHVDGRPAGAATPASGSITVPNDEGFFFSCRFGLLMLPDLRLHPYKGKGGQSPTMQKQRIFRALLALERTYGAAISIYGQTPKDVALTDLDALALDAELEDVLFTGVVRVSGFSGWQYEPHLRITQSTPGPFVLRSLSYDVRF